MQNWGRDGSHPLKVCFENVFERDVEKAVQINRTTVK